MKKAHEFGWINTKDAYPPFGEVVEIFLDERLNGVKLDHAAYMVADKWTERNFWTLHGLDEFSWSKDGFKVKYWRYLRPLPNGTQAFFKVQKNGFMKVIFKKKTPDDN